MKLVEFLLGNDGEGTVLINPAQISGCNAKFDDNGVWQGTDIWLTGGHYIRVNASYEQIEDTLANF